MATNRRVWSTLTRPCLPTTMLRGFRKPMNTLKRALGVLGITAADMAAVHYFLGKYEFRSIMFAGLANWLTCGWWAGIGYLPGFPRTRRRIWGRNLGGRHCAERQTA